MAPWHHEPARDLEFAMADDLASCDAVSLDPCLGERSALATCDADVSLVASRLGIRIHS